MFRGQFTYGFFSVLFFLVLTSTSELLNSEEDDGGYIKDPKVRKGVSWAHKCANKSFICTYDCNVVTNVTGDCTRPSGTSCFNFIVDYNYTLWKTPFPHHLAGLQNFPTCWQVLEPLICGIWYRPCAAMRTFNVRRGTPKMSEFVKTYSMDYCYGVRSKCQQFLHLLPPELDCDKFDHPRQNLRPDLTLYNPECELTPAFNYTLLSSPPRCFQHLSLSTGLDSIKPIVDQCYLPCRTDYFGHINAFYHFVFIFCTAVAFFAPALPIYLSKNVRKPKMATWNYVFNHCVVNICIYFGLWSIFLMLVYFKKTAVCQQDQFGNALRIDFYTIWCKAQRIALQFFLSSIISWSLVLSYCLLVDRNFNKSSEKTKWILSVVVYLLSVTLVVMSMIWDVYYADPYYGVCHPGMDPLLSGLFLYVPAVLTSIFLLATYLIGRHTGQMKPVRKAENSKPVVGVNLGGIHINLSFPGLAANLFIFVMGAITHFSPSRSTHDEVQMVKNSINCFTNHSESLLGLVQQGNSTSNCMIDPPDVWQPVWIFVRMHFLPILPLGVIFCYLFYALKDGILNTALEENGHELVNLKPIPDEEEKMMENGRPNSNQRVLSTSDSEVEPPRRRRRRKRPSPPIIRDGIASSDSSVFSDPPPNRLPPNYEIGLYRIALEAMMKNMANNNINGPLENGNMVAGTMNMMPGPSATMNMMPGPSATMNMMPGPSGTLNFAPTPMGNQNTHQIPMENIAGRPTENEHLLDAMEAIPGEGDDSSISYDDDSNDFNSDELNSNDERDLAEEAQRRAQIHQQYAQK